LPRAPRVTRVKRNTCERGLSPSSPESFAVAALAAATAGASTGEDNSQFVPRRQQLRQRIIVMSPDAPEAITEVSYQLDHTALVHRYTLLLPAAAITAAAAAAVALLPLPGVRRKLFFRIVSNKNVRRVTGVRPTLREGAIRGRHLRGGWLVRLQAHRQRDAGPR
jgi:hypothetical protein